jgi:hypothetical protein
MAILVKNGKQVFMNVYRTLDSLICIDWQEEYKINNCAVQWFNSVSVYQSFKTTADFHLVTSPCLKHTQVWAGVAQSV